MTLARTRPIRTWPLDRDLFEPFDRLFAGLDAPSLNGGSESGYPFDLYETDEALVLQMPVPGLSPDDLDLGIEGRQLTLRATIPDEQGEDRRYWMQGIPRGQMARSIKLPASVAADDIEARVQDGLLTLTMPKVQEAKVRKIAVSRD